MQANFLHGLNEKENPMKIFSSRDLKLFLVILMNMEVIKIHDHWRRKFVNTGDLVLTIIIIHYFLSRKVSHL
jgi:hypothetical protein